MLERVRVASAKCGRYEPWRITSINTFLESAQAARIGKFVNGINDPLKTEGGALPRAVNNAKVSARAHYQAHEDVFGRIFEHPAPPLSQIGKPLLQILGLRLLVAVTGGEREMSQSLKPQAICSGATGRSEGRRTP